MSQHSMVTRSKAKKNNKITMNIKEKKINKPPPSKPDNEDDIDEYGNIKDLIDYSYDESPKKSKIKKSKKSKNKQLSDIVISYMLMDAMNNTILYNSQKKNKISKKKRIQEKIQEKSLNDNSEILKNLFKEENLNNQVLIFDKEGNIINDQEIIDEDNDSIELETNDEEEEEEDGNKEEENNEEVEINDEEEDGNEEEEDDEDFELSCLDEEYLELLDEEEVDSDEEFDYFYKLDDSKKHLCIETLKDISNVNKRSIPLKFKILESKMDVQTKSVAIHNVEKMNAMDPSSGEYNKMDKWLSGLIKIPFGEYSNLSINSENNIEEKRNFILDTKKTLDKAIFGHKEAKLHILQVIGQWITNPKSHGNVLALQGPMGNGKTTLVKEGIAKAIGRPFAFIALGGTSDSSYFDGHSYTYEGSHWGRIIDILMTSKCMNPIIYFDELDKVSETYKGQEVIHFLTHLTDQSQNSLYQDNYFPGINIDLSKCLFIFSFNDESKVDRILKDRMYVINTKGFNTKDKIKICKDYLLPEILETFIFTNKDIIFSDEVIENIINNFTNKEEGVRNLKRCIETTISKINIYNLSYNENNEKENIDLTFEIKNFKLPLTITTDIVNTLLKNKESNAPPSYMYM